MEYKEQVEKRVEQKVKFIVTKVVKVLFFIILGLALAFLIGYVVMRLWNWLMPELFGLPSIGYWQAVGMLILAKIFFGFGSGSGPGKNTRSKNKPRYKRCGSLRKDFTDWKHYDEFWATEGERAYKQYLERKEQKNETHGDR
ncbi:hypothetical protein [Costertonia aggregata]|uniref:Uncharacterized protein n=1 Tax=Costertonia aggregata TaxID=343403 RepID=A0A7H9ANV3_9FLAO|nr:hypothetical protein [Costertonia aggregata]QLG45107.1 hypothetical protein HYG79_07005 [Costertonia aggregata]